MVSYNFKKGRLLVLFFISIVSFLLVVASFIGLFIFWDEIFGSIKSYEDYFTFFLGVATAIFLLFLTINLMVASFGTYRKKVALVITEDGFINNSETVNFGFVSWGGVASVQRIVIDDSAAVIVHLNDQEAFNRKAWFKKFFMTRNNGEYAILIQTGILDGDEFEVLRAMKDALEG